MKKINSKYNIKIKRLKAMKKFTIFTTMILLSSLMVACGGGGSGGNSGGGNGNGGANPPPAANTDSLIIDNGRGTVNNQDTERSQ